MVRVCVTGVSSTSAPIRSQSKTKARRVAAVEVLGSIAAVESEGEGRGRREQPTFSLILPAARGISRSVDRVSGTHAVHLHRTRDNHDTAAEFFFRGNFHWRRTSARLRRGSTRGGRSINRGRSFSTRGTIDPLEGRDAIDPSVQIGDTSAT